MGVGGDRSMTTGMAEGGSDEAETEYVVSYSGMKRL